MRYINSENEILDADSYKTGHPFQLPEGTEGAYHYISSRGGLFGALVNFGMSMFLQKKMENPVTMSDVLEAEYFSHLKGISFHKEGWMHIVDKHGGFMPVRIFAPKEGMITPVNTPMAGIWSYDSKAPWAGGHLESSILRAVWYPATVATLSFEIRKVIKGFMVDTCDTLDKLDYMHHDFGARAATSKESSGIGGLSHQAAGSRGSDTMYADLMAMKYYDPRFDEGISSNSIDAAEHFTITSFGRDKEVEAYRTIIARLAKPGSLVALVADSYDVYNACENHFGGTLKQQIIDSGATIVIRPDSGHPPEVVMKCLNILEDKYGVTYNTKGYKLLNHVRLIQGDGVDMEMIRTILQVMKDAGYSADNIAFGMGGKLHQAVDRDTQKFAMKASAVKINGVWYPVAKDPITDPGKKSDTGLLMLREDPNGVIRKFSTLDEGLFYDKCVVAPENPFLWSLVHDTGETFHYPTLSEIRARVQTFL